MAAAALEAQNDPQQRKDFIQKSLNVFVSSARAYFNLFEFQTSDRKYNWTLDELAKLPIKWYGGADLSKLYDLTAAVLYGVYDGVNIIIPHCWFPVTAAEKKADEDNIPLFGWQDEGWLTMSNGKTVNHAEVVEWFIEMKRRGFKIAEVGHDRKFCREYFVAMKKAGFKIIDQPQYFYKNPRDSAISKTRLRMGCCTISTRTRMSTVWRTYTPSKRPTTWLCTTRLTKTRE